jgi:hypothetical protein
MARSVVIEFSLIEESKGRTDNEIIKDILAVFSSEEIVIPWIEKVEEINFSKI